MYSSSSPHNMHTHTHQLTAHACTQAQQAQQAQLPFLQQVAAMGSMPLGGSPLTSSSSSSLHQQLQVCGVRAAPHYLASMHPPFPCISGSCVRACVCSSTQFTCTNSCSPSAPAALGTCNFPHIAWARHKIKFARLDTNVHTYTQATQSGSVALGACVCLCACVCVCVCVCLCVCVCVPLKHACVHTHALSVRVCV